MSMDMAEDWKDSPIVKFILLTVGGAIVSKTAGRVIDKVRGEVRQIDLNRLIEDPGAEAKALAERLKDDYTESIDNMKEDVAYVREKGLGSIIRNGLKDVRWNLVGGLTSLVEHKYALTSDLKVEGVNATIGEYLNERKPVLLETADRVRNFAYGLLANGDALPRELGYEEEDGEIRLELITDFVGFATTDVDLMIERLERATTRESIVFKDDDPTLRRRELAVLKTYAEPLRMAAEKYAPKGKED